MRKLYPFLLLALTSVCAFAQQKPASPLCGEIAPLPFKCRERPICFGEPGSSDPYCRAISSAQQAPTVLPSSFVQHLGSAGGTSQSFSGTGANLIVVGASTYGGYCSGVADSMGNSYVSDGVTNSGAGDVIQIYHVFSPNTSGAMTFTCTGPNASIAVLPVSGTFSGVVEGANGNGTTAGTSLQTGTTGALTGTPNEFCPSFITYSATSSTVSIDSSFTLLAGHFGSDGATYQGLADAYLIPSSGTALNPTWTFPSGRGAVRIGCYK